MRKESLITLFACGCLSWGTLPAAAQLSWNPFSKAAEQRSEQTIPSSSNSLRSPLTSAVSVQPELHKSISPAAIQQLPSAKPITNSTYRMILEESKNYPMDIRQKFVTGFSKLSDSEARKRIERIRLARAEQHRNRTASVATNEAPANVSWQQASYQQAARSPVQPLAPSSPGVATTQSTLPDWSQFAQESPGHASTGEAAINIVRKPAQLPSNSFGSEAASLDNPTQAVRSASDRGGVAQVPQQRPSSSGLRVIPVGHSSTSLPMIRPANTNDDHSHYATHYAPASSEQRQLTHARRTAPPSEKLVQTGSQENPRFVTTSQSQQSDAANIELLISQMEALANQSQPGTSAASLQQHVTTHVELRLLYLVSAEKDRALSAIPGLSREEQVFWTRVFWGLTNYLDHTSSADKTERTTVALDQLRHAIQSLQGEAKLTIRHTEFCSEIENFGNYTRYDRDEFASGQEILVYCELENFKSEQTENNIYRTLLKSSIQLRSAGAEGESIDQVPYNPTEDLCRSQRKDFMQGFKYRLPQRLSAGAYVLELVIEDQLSGQSARSSLNFVVK